MVTLPTVILENKNAAVPTGKCLLYLQFQCYNIKKSSKCIKLKLIINFNKQLINSQQLFFGIKFRPTNYSSAYNSRAATFPRQPHTHFP